MSVGPLFYLPASVAGVPLAQSKGTDIDRAEQEAGAVELAAEGEKKAEAAAGIGEADGENHQTADRDADGRQILVKPGRRQAAAPVAADPPPQQSKDPSRQSGNQLDLNG